MKTLKLLLFICFTAFCLKSEAQIVLDQKTIPSPDSLLKGVGKKTEILVAVFDTKYIEKLDITYLNVGDNYPNQVLTLVIKGEDRKKFTHPPETYYKNRELKIVGIPELYNGKLQIVIHDPSQIIESVKTVTNK